MANQPASAAGEKNHERKPDDAGDVESSEHEEFDPEEEPIGTLALLSVYLIVIVGLWVAVYVTLIERS